MLACHDASKQVVTVSLDATERHIACCLHVGDVKPNGNMLQLSPLQLVDSAGIPWTHRVRSHVATAVHPVRDGVDRQVAPRLGHHVDTAGAGVVTAHGGLHAVHKVRALVHITGEVHPKATVQLHVQGRRRPAQDDLVLVIKVVGVGLPVHFEIRQLPLPLKLAPNFCYCAVDQEKAVVQWKWAVSGLSALLGPEMVKFAPNFRYCAVDQEKAVFQWKRAVSGPSALLGPEMVKFAPNFCYCAVRPRKGRFSMETGRFWPILPFGARNGQICPEFLLLCCRHRSVDQKKPFVY